MTEERYRHKKRGSTYTVIARGFFQVDGDLDNEKVVVYRDEDGRAWVRPEYEFNDGRFERLPDEVTELSGPILKYISRDAKRETFEVPEGYEAVRDADCRATGEVRKIDPTTTVKLLALMKKAHAVMRACGWHLAPASDTDGDGVLEAAAAEIEADIRAAIATSEGSNNG